MEKPTILKVKETEDRIVQIINESNVPAFTIRPVLERLLAEVKTLEEKEYQQEKTIYEENLKKEEGKNE